MRALAIRQPWPWAIFSAPQDLRKDVENRDWWTSLRGRIVVHASARPGEKRWGEEWSDYCATARHVSEGRISLNLALLPAHDALTFGALIGTVEIVDCMTSHPSRWFFGPYGFVLREPRLFPTPIPFKGAQKFFDVPDGILPLG